MVSIGPSQGLDPGSIPGRRTRFLPTEKARNSRPKILAQRQQFLPVPVAQLDKASDYESED